MYYWHALPENWELMVYNDFLEERRKLMALVIKDAYEVISGQKTNNSVQTEFKYFLKFKNEHPNLIPYRTEWRIFDEEYQIAGTILTHPRHESQSISTTTEYVYRGSSSKL